MSSAAALGRGADPDDGEPGQRRHQRGRPEFCRAHPARFEEWAGAEQIAQTELGDTDFVDVDYDAMACNGSGSGNADGEEEPLAGDAPASDSENMDKPGNTTHITVVDGDGTVVSMTNTLTEFWGSGQGGGRVFLNDQLSRFSTVTSPTPSGTGTTVGDMVEPDDGPRW